MRQAVADDVRDDFRKAVLAALDECAVTSFGLAPDTQAVTDGDLPELFKTIDALTATLADRFGVEMMEDPELG